MIHAGDRLAGLVSALARSVGFWVPLAVALGRQCFRSRDAGAAVGDFTSSTRHSLDGIQFR